MVPPAALVLIIEDDPGIADLIKDCVALAGYRPELAPTGDIGLAMAAETTPTLVLLDMNLPGLHGLDVLESLRASHPRTPVIVITASDDYKTVSEALRRGAFSYIPKPFKPEYLQHLMAAALDGPLRK